MRTVTDYLLKAIEFDDLAKSVSDSGLRKRYADLAESYRLLAQERERLVASGALPDRPPRK
jgi:hypothetical protein